MNLTETLAKMGIMMEPNPGTDIEEIKDMDANQLFDYAARDGMRNCIKSSPAAPMVMSEGNARLIEDLAAAAHNQAVEHFVGRCTEAPLTDAERIFMLYLIVGAMKNSMDFMWDLAAGGLADVSSYAVAQRMASGEDVTGALSAMADRIRANQKAQEEADG